MPDFMNGLAKGIEKSKGVVAKAVEGVSQDMVINPNVNATSAAMESTSTSSAQNTASIVGACQTADYLGRFPQIISDGNTCHSLRSMRQKHIISGVTADYRGLISVQLWLD